MPDHQAPTDRTSKIKTELQNSRHHPEILLQARFPRIPDLPDDGHHLALFPFARLVEVDGWQWQR
jgi:hypothetical protein